MLDYISPPISVYGEAGLGGVVRERGVQVPFGIPYPQSGESYLLGRVLYTT